MLNLHTTDSQIEMTELDPAGREDPLSFLGGDESMAGLEEKK